MPVSDSKAAPSATPAPNCLRKRAFNASPRLAKLSFSMRTQIQLANSVPTAGKALPNGLRPVGRNLIMKIMGAVNAATRAINARAFQPLRKRASAPTKIDFIVTPYCF